MPRSTIRTITIDDVPISYSVRGPTAAPTLVLVHGATAHGGWWASLIDRLGPSVRTIAVDLSGHGDSGRHSRYDAETWAGEVRGVVEQECHATGELVLVGHSVGGLVCLRAATSSARVDRLVMIDSAIQPPSQPLTYAKRRPSDDPHRIYTTREEIVGRFRLLPRQPPVPAERLDRIIEGAITRAGHGWTWKHDPKVVGVVPESSPLEWLGDLRQPLTLIYGSESPFTHPDVFRFVEKAVRGQVETHVVAGSHHHVMVDQPQQVSEILLTTVQEAGGRSMPNSRDESTAPRS